VFGYWGLVSSKNMKTIQMPYSGLAHALGLQQDVFLKREDQHKYGSHKGRSLPGMIKFYFKENNLSNFVISSSGNAALAAIHSVQTHNRNNPEKIRLTVFIGQNIAPQKMKTILAVLDDANIKLEQVERPKQSAFLMDKDGKAKLLRQSTDDNALTGYYELAEELSKIPELSAVFVPTSSGTCAEGLGEAFTQLGLNPQIHTVQTPACHPIVDSITQVTSSKLPLGLSSGRRQVTNYDDEDNDDTPTSLAGAIVDNVAHRKDKVAEVVKKSGGAGWIASDDEIKEIINLVEDNCQLKISANSALSVVGLKKAVDAGYKFTGPVVCLITGM